MCSTCPTHSIPRVWRNGWARFAVGRDAWLDPDFMLSGRDFLCVPLLFLGYFPSVAPHACDAALSLYASPQDSRAAKTGERLMPNSVRAYSTLGGTSA